MGFIHGNPMTRTYRKWDSMKGRCYRKTHPAWPWYGAKGITVCDRWKDSFQHFLSDMGECPDGYWIDRIDNTKGYEPGNCRWVTPKESAANRKPRSQVEGSMRQMARKAGLPYYCVYQRMRSGLWTLDEALKTPVKSRVKRFS